MKLNRRRFLSTTGAIAVGSSLGLHASETRKIHKFPVIKELPSLKGRKILYTYGGWKGHEPVESLDVFKPWLEKEGALVDFIDNLDPYADETYMKNIDLVIQTFTMGEITGEQENGLIKAVSAGCGLAGWHGGLCYTFGILFFKVIKFPYHHLVWHILVLAGTISHFFAVFFYMIPR
jgi:hypothetical protein